MTDLSQPPRPIMPDIPHEQRSAIRREALEEVWFCDRGNFWGTINQLFLCAKCGKDEKKRHDESRRYAYLCTPKAHTLCEECFETLPLGIQAAAPTMEPSE